MTDHEHDPVARWLAGIGTGVLILILIWSIVSTLTGPSNADRLDRLEAEIAFQTCLILTPPEERTQAAVSTCLPNGESGE
jgi:hypothetical protein